MESCRGENILEVFEGMYWEFLFSIIGCCLLVEL